MEIVHRGTLPEARQHTATCNHCKSVLRFIESEAERFDDQREGAWLTVKCPVCQKLVSKNL